MKCELFTFFHNCNALSQSIVFLFLEPIVFPMLFDHVLPSSVLHKQTTVLYSLLIDLIDKYASSFFFFSSLSNKLLIRLFIQIHCYTLMQRCPTFCFCMLEITKLQGCNVISRVVNGLHPSPVMKRNRSCSYYCEFSLPRTTRYSSINFHVRYFIHCKSKFNSLLLRMKQEVMVFTPHGYFQPRRLAFRKTFRDL